MTLQQSIVLALQASIFMTVFDFGLQATFDDVLYVVRRPSLLVRSLVAMFVIMPVVAVTLAETFTFLESIEIALVALSISPIPPLLPGKEKDAGGDASYGLGLMAIAGGLSIVILPLTLQLLGRYFGRPFAMSSGAIARVVLTSVILPLAAGLALRAIAPRLARRLRKPVGLVARTVLAIGVLGLLAGVLPAALALVGNGTLVALAVFAAVGLVVGHWLGGPRDDDRLVLALSTASRHPAIALAVASANFPDEPNLGASIVLYLLVNALVAFPFLAWRKRRAPA